MACSHLLSQLCRHVRACRLHLRPSPAVSGFHSPPGPRQLDMDVWVLGEVLVQCFSCVVGCCSAIASGHTLWRTGSGSCFLHGHTLLSAWAQHGRYLVGYLPLHTDCLTCRSLFAEEIDIIAVVILAVLFLVQRFGTGAIGFTFSPIILLWCDPLTTTNFTRDGVRCLLCGVAL